MSEVEMISVPGDGWMAKGSVAGLPDLEGWYYSPRDVAKWVIDHCGGTKKRYNGSGGHAHCMELFVGMICNDLKSYPKPGDPVEIEYLWLGAAGFPTSFQVRNLKTNKRYGRSEKELFPRNIDTRATER